MAAKILVVDDSHLFRTLIRHYVEEPGHGPQPSTSVPPPSARMPTCSAT